MSAQISACDVVVSSWHWLSLPEARDTDCKSLELSNSVLNDGYFGDGKGGYLQNGDNNSPLLEGGKIDTGWKWTIDVKELIDSVICLVIFEHWLFMHV